MYEHPDDAQPEVKHLKYFKNSTNSPGYFAPFIVDKMNTWTNVFNYGCLGDHTVDTPYARRFNTFTFYPSCSRQVVAKKKSNYIRDITSTRYDTANHPIKYKSFNSPGLSLTNDDERSSKIPSNVYTSDGNELKDDISTTKTRIRHCPPESTTIICETISRVSDLEYVVSRSINTMVMLQK